MMNSLLDEQDVLSWEVAQRAAVWHPWTGRTMKALKLAAASTVGLWGSTITNCCEMLLPSKQPLPQLLSVSFPTSPTKDLQCENWLFCFKLNLGPGTHHFYIQQALNTGTTKLNAACVGGDHAAAPCLPQEPQTNPEQCKAGSRGTWRRDKGQKRAAPSFWRDKLWTQGIGGGVCCSFFSRHKWSEGKTSLCRLPT